MSVCDPMNCSMPRFPVLCCLPRVCSASYPLSRWDHPTVPTSATPFSSCPSVFPSIRVFSSELALHIRWPKYWSFGFSIRPSNEYSGWISFRIDWFGLLAVQGTLKSLLQHHSSKASLRWHSAFFYCPALTSIHDCWKNNSFNYTDLCWPSDFSSF